MVGSEFIVRTIHAILVSGDCKDPTLETMPMSHCSSSLGFVSFPLPRTPHVNGRRTKSSISLRSPMNAAEKALFAGFADFFGLGISGQLQIIQS